MNDDEIWAAGVLSVSGSLFIRSSSGHSAVALTVASRTRRDAVHKLAVIAGANCITGDKGMKMTLSGEPLHQFMRRVWDRLPYDRKQEYAKLRAAVKAMEN